MMTATEIKQRTRDIANNFVNGSMSTTDWRACIDSPSTAVAVYIQLQNKRNMPKGHGRADFLPALKAAEKLRAELVEEAQALCCPGCGSKNIQSQMWVGTNTGKVLDETGNYNWCEDCQSEFNHAVEAEV